MFGKIPFVKVKEVFISELTFVIDDDSLSTCRPQSATNVITLNAIIRTRPNANIDFSLTFNSEWALDYHGWWLLLWTETLFISASRNIM